MISLKRKDSSSKKFEVVETVLSESSNREPYFQLYFKYMIEQQQHMHVKQALNHFFPSPKHPSHLSWVRLSENCREE